MLFLIFANIVIVIRANELVINIIQDIFTNNPEPKRVITIPAIQFKITKKTLTFRAALKEII